MFDWKVEEMELNKTKNVITNHRGYYDRIEYPIEDNLSTKEKIDAIDCYLDGNLKYFMNLNAKYMNDLKNGIIKCGSFGYPRENSKKSWIRRNDTLHIFWNGKSKDNTWTYDYLHLPFGYMTNIYFGHELTDDKVNEVFNKYLRMLEQKEIEWFKAHDEYEIKLKELRDYGFEAVFDNHIGFRSDGNVYVINKDGMERKITLEEINILLDNWKKVLAYKDELKKVVKITF